MFEFLLRHINLIRGLTNIYARCQDWHNAPITPITTFTLGDKNRHYLLYYTLDIFIHHTSKGQVSKSLTRCLCLYLISQCFSICQMSLRWMRRESEAIESGECGQTWHWAESSKQDDRQSRGLRGELIRDIMSYSEQAGGKLPGIVSPLCTGRRHNVQHMAWWYTSSVGGTSLYILLCYYERTDLSPSRSKLKAVKSKAHLIFLRVQSQSHQGRDKKRKESETLGSGARAQQGAGTWHLCHLLLHLHMLKSSNARENVIH